MDCPLHASARAVAVGGSAKAAAAKTARLVNRMIRLIMCSSSKMKIDEPAATNAGATLNPSCCRAGTDIHKL
ncbi:MAG: hypothetical protein U0974_08920 [Gemmatimonadales bacterium]|nr:hypothetical protein [Gemmatimonadales bacterium]